MGQYKIENNMKNNLLIIGGKSTALEIYDVINSHLKEAYLDIVFVIGDNESMNDSYNFITDSELEDYVNKYKCCYIISFANHKLRVKFANLMNTYGIKPINIIHPSSIISSSANIGVGNYIAAGSIISYNAVINNHCMINFNATVGHDSYIKDHCIINPGARISGNVNIGERVLIGTNSIIFQGKNIGNDCLIDALTYIDRDIDDRMICSSRQLKIFKRVL
jgi:sugar O-acyltransferase (sialic acid O-acetyltransferase NeuD family)